eukprot:CAMPEP_0198151124 /NCGR_PEP_ID=MMETSP1443-20131203/54366_1 /TAXON_ID=186043 /ORGANISM="Entomoneis sp., Strain CCMP2396" /LENGTH=198 /DNA_ID=CAMNT_0043816697 /DNA_START=123 /DNA_END=719 /DNA_ORIENTATION=-
MAISSKYRLNQRARGKLEKYSTRLLEQASQLSPSAIEIHRTLTKCPDAIFARTDDAGYTALHYACELGASLEVIESLVKAWPESVKETTKFGGYLPLHLCFTSSMQHQASLSVVRYIISCFSDAIKTTADGGMLPLHVACFYGATIEVVAELLRHSNAAGVAFQMNSSNRTAEELALHPAFPLAGVNMNTVQLFRASA